MKAIFHIGSPKTGTSSVQHFLHENRHALRDEGFYFRRVTPTNGSQYEYAMAAFELLDRHLESKDAWTRYAVGTREQQRKRVQPALGGLKRIPAQAACHTALFSSEHAFAWLRRPQTIQSFHSMLSDVFEDVRYILYLREPTSAYTSQYSELIKRGKTFDLDEFVNEHVNYGSYVSAVKNWVATVGRKNIDVRIFDPSLLKTGDIVADYCDAAGLDFKKYKVPPKINEALTGVGAEVMRALNGFIPELDRAGFFNHGRDGFLRRVQERTATSPRLALTASQHEMARSDTDGVVSELRQEIFPDRNQVFPERPRQAADLALTRKHALDVMAELVVQERSSINLDCVGGRQFARAVVDYIKLKSWRIAKRAYYRVARP